MTESSNADTPSERWSFSLEAESAVLAEQDLARAMVLQNARFATRFDLMRRHRNAQAEARVRLFALGLCAFGILMAILLVVFRFMTMGELYLRDVGLFFLLVSLFFVFWFQDRLRQAWVTRVDGMLWGRAKKTIEKSLSDPAERHYEIEGGEVRRIDDDKPVMTRALASLPYGLIGDASILLYKTRTKQNPGMILLISPSERERVVAALRKAGASLEPLSNSLLPTLNVRRRW